MTDRATEAAATIGNYLVNPPVTEDELQDAKLSLDVLVAERDALKAKRDKWAREAIIVQADVVKLSEAYEALREREQSLRDEIGSLRDENGKLQAELEDAEYWLAKLGAKRSVLDRIRAAVGTREP